VAECTLLSAVTSASCSWPSPVSIDRLFRSDADWSFVPECCARTMFERVRFVTKYSPHRIPYVSAGRVLFGHLSAVSTLSSNCSVHLQADEEVVNDLNGASDIDLTTMKPSSTSNTAVNSLANRRNQPMDMNMYATRKTIAQGTLLRIHLAATQFYCTLGIMDLGLMCANASQLKCRSCLCG